MKFCLALSIFAVLSFSTMAEASCCQGRQCPLENVNKTYSKQAVSAYKAAMKTMHKNMMVGYTGDVDTDFARGMIPHHQGAVDMANIVLKYGNDPFVRDFAEWVVTIQQQEIAMMQHWLTRRGVAEGKPSADYDPKAIAAFERSMQSMHRAMDIQYTGNADIDFVLGMIPHHQGAVDMAAVELASGEDPEMHKLASNIIASQNGEIARMRDWLKEHGIKYEKAYQSKKSHNKHSDMKHTMGMNHH